MTESINMAGQRFGRLAVLGQLPRERAKALRLRRGAHWICQCDCGQLRIAFGNMLRSGAVTACKVCTKSETAAKTGASLRLDVTGERYGMLVAIRFVKSVEQGAYWLFDCDCGKQATLRLKDVRQGNTLSCGCLKNATGHSHGAPRLMTARPWRDTPTTFAKSFEAECAAARIEVKP